MKALSEGDRVEVVDGACDLFVVSSYALWLLESSGVRWEKCLKPAEGAQFNIGEMVELIFNTPCLWNQLLLSCSSRWHYVSA